MKLNYNFLIYGLLILVILGGFFINRYDQEVKSAKTSLAQQPKQLDTPQTTTVPQIIAAKSSEQSPIKIIGDSTCIKRTNQALDLLKDNAMVDYNVVVKYIGIIECAENWSGMYAWEKPPRFRVGKANIDAGPVWYAGAIAHDSCHSKQYHDYLLDHPDGPVPLDIYSGRNAEAQCLDFQYDALSRIGASQETLDYVKNSINSDYWNVTNRRW